MNTLHFKYAVEVEKSRSITQAADNLFMAQPNLSKAIKELEDTVGYPIFRRTSKGVVPTEKGGEFLQYARNILDQLEKMEDLSVSDEEKQQNFGISIPRGSYIANGVVKFISDLDLEKGINVNIQETNSMQAINNITEGQFRLGIIRYQKRYENYFLDYLSDKHLCYEPVWEFECLALFSGHSPLARKREITDQDLESYVELSHGDNVVPYLTAGTNKKQGKKQEHKKAIYVYERCSQFELLDRIPLTYMWVSPIPDGIMARYDLVQRKCQGINHKYKDVLIYSKGYKFTELDKKFIGNIYEAKNEVSFVEYL